MPTPCHSCAKSSEGRPNPAAEMRGRNAATYELYLSVRAGHPAPADETFRQNCAVIEMVRDQVEHARSDSAAAAIAALGGTRG